MAKRSQRNGRRVRRISLESLAETEKIPTTTHIKALRLLKEYASPNGFVGTSEDLIGPIKKLGYILENGRHLKVMTPDGHYVVDPEKGGARVTFSYGKSPMSGSLFRRIALIVSSDYERRTGYPLHRDD